MNVSSALLREKKLFCVKRRGKHRYFGGFGFRAVSGMFSGMFSRGVHSAQPGEAGNKAMDVLGQVPRHLQCLFKPEAWQKLAGG